MGSDYESSSEGGPAIQVDEVTSDSYYDTEDQDFFNEVQSQDEIVSESGLQNQAVSPKDLDSGVEGLGSGVMGGNAKPIAANRSQQAFNKSDNEAHKSQTSKFKGNPSKLSNYTNSGRPLPFNPIRHIAVMLKQVREQRVNREINQE